MRKRHRSTIWVLLVRTVRQLQFRNTQAYAQNCVKRNQCDKSVYKPLPPTVLVILSQPQYVLYFELFIWNKTVSKFLPNKMISNKNLWIFYHFGQKSALCPKDLNCDAWEGEEASQNH